MAKERLAVRKLREILRQKLLLERSHRRIAQSVGVSAGKVGTIASRAKALDLDWQAAQQMDDEQLQHKIYGRRKSGRDKNTQPDMAYIHIELRKVGVTLLLLHQEYLEANPKGYHYATFCRLYRKWKKRRGTVMRQTHKAGDKGFVDYSGKKPQIINQHTGEAIDVELFVIVLGASNYTYAEATFTQKVHDFISSHIRAMEYFGGAPRALVPDQLKSAVTKPCRYEPLIQRTYEAMAGHYDTTVLPARPRKPKDKAKVEGGVLLAQRWIMARIRNQTFFSLAELNERIRELLEELNNRPMKKYKASRLELFLKLDSPELSPLPMKPFTCGEWQAGRANIDYHIEFDYHYYSVSYLLANEELEVYATGSTVEILHNGKRVALHARSHERGGHTTKKEHMPIAHQKHAQWSPSRLVRWAETIGPNTAELVRVIMEKQRHPERGYRSCLGLMKLSKRYGNARLEVASGRAMDAGAYSYRHIESMLKHGLDRMPLTKKTADNERDKRILVHENVRGADYYSTCERTPVLTLVPNNMCQAQRTLSAEHDADANANRVTVDSIEPILQPSTSRNNSGSNDTEGSNGMVLH